MKWKKLVAAALSVFMIGGAFIDYSPIVKESVIAADAADYKEVTVNGVPYWVYEKYACVIIHKRNDFNYTSIEKEIDGVPVNHMWIESDSDIYDASINNAIFPYGFEVYDGAIYSLDNEGKKESLLICPISKRFIALPEGLKSFNNGAFLLTNIESIEIPKTITEIPDNCFEFCGRLKEITIPSKVKSLGHHSFYGCISLSKVNIPESVTSIPDFCFYECRSLEEITIPYNIQSIGKCSFEFCSKLKNVTFLNPDCIIDDNCNFDISNAYIFDCTIKGYKGSTAEEYAKKHSKITFESLSGDLCHISVVSDNSSKGTTTSSFRCGPGQKTSITATPKEGYKFDYWLDKDGKKYTNNPLTITATKDTIYTAYFAPSTYNVTVETSDAKKGTVTGGGSYDETKKATLKATPAENYVFDYWIDENGNKYTDNPLLIGLKGGQTLTYTAYFKDITYNISASSNYATYGTVSGGKKAVKGEKVTLTAKPAKDAVFLLWRDKNGNEYFDNPLTVTATEDMTYKAIFDEKINITEQPEGIVYFDTGAPAKISLTATGPIDCYTWYFKRPDKSSFAIDEEFEPSEWTGSYDFVGTSQSGLTDAYDGTEVYCKLWNWLGQSVESERFILKKYKSDVDRNVTIKLPEVGQTFADYIAELDKNVKPAELILKKDEFYISTYDANGKAVPDAEEVFKAGYKYEFCMNLNLPEDVSPTAIYQFYSKGTIVNGEEHDAADSLDEDELRITDFWMSPVLEAPVITGDINNDGNIDKIDDVLLARYTSGWDGVTVNEAAADINHDGIVDLLDSVILSRYIAGWEEYKTYFAI